MTAASLVLLASTWSCGTDDCEGTQCGPCQSPINLAITDAASGSAVDKVTVTGDLAATCDKLGTQTTCLLGDSGTKPGTFKLTVSAVGYKAVSLDVQVLAGADGGCCNCGYTSVNKQVQLTKK
jgi:hypothetical protein